MDFLCFDEKGTIEEPQKKLQYASLFNQRCILGVCQVQDSFHVVLRSVNMDGDVTGNDNISGVSDDRESRETFAGFSASAAGESTTDINSGLVERPEEHYESDGESSDVDVDDAMSSGSDADDQDNSSLTMPPPDAETSSEKTSLATAPTATELTIPPLLQLLISFVLFYADVGTDVAAVVEAEADVTAPRNLVYLMVCMTYCAHESDNIFLFFFPPMHKKDALTRTYMIQRHLDVAYSYYCTLEL